MKRSNCSVIAILSFLFLFSGLNLKAMNWEVGVKVLNSDGNPESKLIIVYKYDFYTKKLVFHGQGYSQTSYAYADGKNAAFDIGDSDTQSPTISPLGEEELFYIRIENKLVKLVYGWGAFGDIELIYRFGNFSVEDNTSSYSLSFSTYDDKSITLKNDFGGDRSNANVQGKVFINSEQLNNVGYSGTTQYREATTFPHTISGEDNQYIETYYRKWRNWNDGTYGISKNLTDVQDYNLMAVYARKCDITVQNDFGGSGSGGNIKFQSTQYSSPYQPSETYDHLTYSAEALSHTINSVYYTFKN